MSPRPVLLPAVFLVLASLPGCGSGSSSGQPADAGEDVAHPDTTVETVEDPEPDAEEVVADPVEDDPVDLAGDPDAWDAEEEAAGSPEGCVEGMFRPYWGNMHAHTSNSDGDGTPAEAFAYARDVAGLDIMVVTDHLEQLYFPGGRWDGCRSAADAATSDGVYVAACGYEYGSGFILPWFWSTGHNNVFFVDYLFPEIQLDFHDFYLSVDGCPDCIAEFNHPGDDPFMTWNDFEYFPTTDVKMNLFEFNTDGDPWPLFFQALDAGWHVSPVQNQDNHSASWGTSDDTRAGLFLAGLTRADLHEAMRDRRSFMTQDRNASVAMMAETSCWMGSILSGIGAVTLGIEAVDGDAGDGFQAIDLFGPGGALVASYDCGGADSCIAAFPLDPAPPYAVARATQADGDLLVSAPVWVEP